VRPYTVTREGRHQQPDSRHALWGLHAGAPLRGRAEVVRSGARACKVTREGGISGPIASALCVDSGSRRVGGWVGGWMKTHLYKPAWLPPGMWP
jgi:hypothetical protein